MVSGDLGELPHVAVPCEGGQAWASWGVTGSSHYELCRALWGRPLLGGKGDLTLFRWVVLGGLAEEKGFAVCTWWGTRQGRQEQGPWCSGMHVVRQTRVAGREVSR